MLGAYALAISTAFGTPPRDLAPSIQYCVFIADQAIANSLRLGLYLVENVDLRYAIAFLQSAQVAFFVGHGGLRDALEEGDWVPGSTLEAVRWETSFFNTYRSVEALIGDPSKDERKFDAALLAAGIAPDLEVGYRNKEPIRTVIRKMNRLRDTKVAHGSTRSRGISLGEMVEYQECARCVIDCAINRRGVLGAEMET